MTQPDRTSQIGLRLSTIPESLTGRAARHGSRPRSISLNPAGAARIGRVRSHLGWSGAALLACGLLRLANNMSLPVYSDESQYVRSGQIAALGPSQWLVQLQHGSPPMLSWLEAPFMSLHLWDAVEAGRFVIALIGALTCLTVMMCAAQLDGGRIVPLAGWAYALCPYAVFNDRVAMLDSPLALWAAVALLFSLRLCLGPAGPRASADLVGLGLAIGAGWLTKFFAVWLELLPLLVAVMGHGYKWSKRLRIALVPLCISLAMLIPFLLTPGGGNLVADVHAHTSSRGILPTLLGQFGAVAGWAVLYLSPCGFALFLAGLGAAGKRRRGWWLAGLWLVLSAASYAAIPSTFAASRYLFFLVVPAALFIALGAHTILRVLRPRFAITLLALVVVAATVQDGILVVSPANAALVPFDRWQYVEGWPSGFGFPQTVAWIRQAAARGPLTVACAYINPPGDALHEELDGNSNVRIMLLDLGNSKAGLDFARHQRGAVIVTDEQTNTHVLSRALLARVRVVAEFWKPGHHAAYRVYRVT